MIDKYAIYDSGESTLPAAVKVVLENRTQQSPFELRVESCDIEVYDNVLRVDGSKDVYQMTQYAVKSLHDLLDIPQKLTEALSPSVLSAVVDNLLTNRETSKLVIRCGRDQGGPFVRAILMSKYGIMDDKILFDQLGRSGIIDIAAAKVVGLWLSESVAAIRCIFPGREMDCGEYKVYPGFDVANSELRSNNSWVKGIIHFVHEKHGKFSFISPKLLPSMQSSNRADLYSLLKQIEAMRVDDLAAEMTVGMAGLDRKEYIGVILGKLYKDNLLSRKDVYGVYEAAGFKLAEHETFGTIFNAAKGKEDLITYFDFTRYLLKYASTLDSYPKRSALEFIPNLFVTRPKNK